MITIVEIIQLIGEIIYELRFMIEKSKDDKIFVLNSTYNSLKKKLNNFERLINSLDELTQIRHSPLVQILNEYKDILNNFSEKKVIFSIKMYESDFTFIYNKKDRIIDLLDDYRSAWKFKVK
jgi:hypothetical protein